MKTLIYFTLVFISTYSNIAKADLARAVQIETAQTTPIVASLKVDEGCHDCGTNKHDPTDTGESVDLVKFVKADVSEGTIDSINKTLCNGDVDSFDDFTDVMKSAGIRENYHTVFKDFYCEEETKYHFMGYLIDDYMETDLLIHKLLGDLEGLVGRDNVANFLNIVDEDGLSLMDYLLENQSYANEKNRTIVDTLISSFTQYGAVTGDKIRSLRVATLE